MKKYFRVMLAIIAILSGLFVLFGYFLDYDRLGLGGIYQGLYQTVVILAAVAVLIGMINLFQTHLTKVILKKPGRFYSLVLILAMFTTLIIAGWLGPGAKLPLWIFNNIQLPVEISLLALLVIVLIMSACRLLSRKPDYFSILFLLTVLFLLVGVGSFRGLNIFQNMDSSRIGSYLDLKNMRNWIMQVPVIAGVRGLLLGVALGTIATGIRLLLGTERPYEN
jgi:hypothetical protein